MEIPLKTGCKCPNCSSDINQIFSAEVIPRSSPARIGGPPRDAPHKMTFLFACELCGSLFIPTKTNKLMLDSQERSEDAIKQFKTKQIHITETMLFNPLNI